MWRDLTHAEDMSTTTYRQETCIFDLKDWDKTWGVSSIPVVTLRRCLVNVAQSFGQSLDVLITSKMLLLTQGQWRLLDGWKSDKLGPEQIL